MSDFRKLEVWRLGHDLARKVYFLTQTFPPSERYELTSQMRRAAISIPANLAEGCGRQSDAELARFVRISLGSITELEYLLLFAQDVGLATEPEAERLLHQVQAMLQNLLRAVTKRRSRNPPNAKPALPPHAT